MKIKTKILSSFLLTAVFTFVLSVVSNVNTFAAIEVYMDGVQLHYTDVEPQIVNDRTMVPLAATATHFGMTYVWNGETRTMVFSGNGRTMIHTVYDNKIYVNGIPVEFNDVGMNSVIVNDRTLMPIRMLAEAIGCVVEWDDLGIVDIWTDVGEYTTPSYPSEDNSNQNTPAPSTPSQQGSSQSPTGQVTIYAVAQDKTAIETGQSFRVSVDTNLVATMVKITDFDGNLLQEITEFTEDTQGRYFKATVTPEETGEVSLKIYAGNEGGYSLESKNLTVVVNAIVKNIFIESIKLSSKSVEPGRDVDVIFYTSKNVTRVVISDDHGTVRKLSNRNDYTNNYYIWETYLYVPDEVGDYTYKITAYDYNDASESESFVVPVKLGAATGNTDGIIKTFDYVRADAKEKCNITVTTDRDVDELQMKTRDGELVSSTTRPAETSGTTLTWKFHIRPDYSENYYLYAFDSNGKEIDYMTVYIDVN